MIFIVMRIIIGLLIMLSCIGCATQEQCAAYAEVQHVNNIY